jgi:adenine-specific DNA-methyltransferase
MPILRWLDRDKHTKASETVPYRLLEADDAQSAGEEDTPNMLIQGDNLETLKALLPYYAGRVKCIFIDPPYNTKGAFEHYDDSLEHSQWLGMMFPRIQLLRDFLAEDGSIWVTIDDNEGHYLKVIMDEVMGRSNFVANMVWEKRTSRENRRVFSFNHDHMLVYGKSKPEFERVRNPLLLSDEILARYKNPDNDVRGSWQSVSANAQAGHATASQFYKLKLPSGREIDPPKGRCWLYTKDRMEQETAAGNIWFGVDGDKSPRIKKFLGVNQEKGLTPETIWPAAEVGTNDDAKKGLLQLLPDAPVFDNPKPEGLLRRVIHIASDPGDLVLDSFLGSGTTAAVAHKMGRRYIGIEMGDQAVSHCVPRLKKVIAGEQGGISQSVNWRGGGGFRFYKLGAPAFDHEGRISPQIRFAHLAAHIWFSETHLAWHKKARSPLLGVHNGAAYYLLYNGILGDKRLDSGNVLTAKILAALPAHDGQKVIYGEACRLGSARLEDLGVIFKQTPYYQD